MKQLILILTIFFAAGTLHAQEKKFMLKDGVVQLMRVYDSLSVKTAIDLKLNKSDTAAMLAAYLTAINGKQPTGSYLTAGNNLADVTNAGTARTNLGLGTLATQNGTISNYLTTTTAASTYQTIITNPVSGTSTANYLTYWNGTGSVSGLVPQANKNLRWNGSTYVWVDTAAITANPVTSVTANAPLSVANPTTTPVITADTSTAITGLATLYQNGLKLNATTAASTYLPLAGGTLTGNLLFSPDNTYDIGGSGVTRPRNLFISNQIITGSTISASNGRTFMGSGRTSATNGLIESTSGRSLEILVDATAGRGMLIETGTGKVGIGTATPSSLLDILSTSTQLRTSYSLPIFNSYTTNSSGHLTIAGNAGQTASFAGNLWTIGIWGAAGNATLNAASGGAGNSNRAGIDLNIGSGQSTGNGAGGKMFFNYTPAGSSGSSVNAYSTAMTIDGTGNVGVGITSPTYKLHVNGTMGVNGNYVFASSGYQTNGSTTWIGQGYGGSYINLLATSGVYLSSTYATTAPAASAVLDINSTTKGLLISRTNRTNISAVSSPATGLLMYDNVMNKMLHYNSSTWTPFLDSTTAAATFSPIAGAWSVTGGDVYRNSGNVGIGTTSPTKLLHIKSLNPQFEFEQTTSGQKYIQRVGNNTGISNNQWNLYDSTYNKILYSFYGSTMVIGNQLNGYVNSSLYVTDIGSGANIDAQADSAKTGEANNELMDANYSNGNGIAMRLWGNSGSVINTTTILGVGNKNMALLDFSKQNNIIRTRDNASLWFGTYNTKAGVVDSLQRWRFGSSLPATDKVEVEGNVSLVTAGNKIKIATGSNASAGVSSAMTAGTITISTTAVTASSLIFLTPVGAGSGQISLGTVTAGTSFVINSSDGADVRAVQYWIVN